MFQQHGCALFLCGSLFPIELQALQEGATWDLEGFGDNQISSKSGFSVVSN